MQCRRTLIASSFLWILLSSYSAQSQTPQSMNDTPAAQLPASLSKQVVERHFESIHPVPRPDGTIPGARLLEEAAFEPLHY